MYLNEMIFAIFCLYFIHIHIGNECIVLSCIVEIHLRLLLLVRGSIEDANGSGDGDGFIYATDKRVCSLIFYIVR